MMNKLDYDFNKFAKAKWSQIGTVVRSHIFDKEAQDFLHQHQNAVCINLAAGLDTRFYRLDCGRADWYNFDLPEVMALRRTLLPEEPENVHNIGRSILIRPGYPRWTPVTAPYFLLWKALLCIFQRTK